MKKKEFYFGTNLKMYKNISDTLAYLQKLEDEVRIRGIDCEKTQLFVIPSYLSLPVASEAFKDSPFLLGAQNMAWEEEGQFTGEISPLMLQELSLDMVMIGHSERRHIFRERDVEENKKVLSALDHNFISLLCIGETAEEKDFGISDEVLRSQIKIGLHGVSKQDLSKVWIAYEPVWAIGVNGKPASIDYAGEKHRVIFDCLSELFGDCAQDIPILYGGSVNPQNATKLILDPHIDGLFVGRSAWDGQKFAKLIDDCIKAAKAK